MELITIDDFGDRYVILEQTAPAASDCCDGSGLADYAAVPCPNPACPVRL